MSSFDFSKVEEAKGSKFLKPGFWRLVPTDVTYEHPENGNPRINVTFTHKSGAALKERFVLTPKALGRLQYLHNAWFGKGLEKAFSSPEQVGEYFKKALLTKSKEMPMTVGGEQTADGKVYARLPFTDFVVKNEDLFEEGEFTQGTPRWNDVVKVKPGAPSLSSDSAILPDSDTPDIADSGKDEDMPW